MSGGTLQAVVTVLFYVELIVATLSVAYIARLYVRRSSESLFFRMLVIADIVKVVAAGVIGVYALVALAGLPRLPHTGIVISIAILLLLSPPILHAYTFWRIRHSADAFTPPPLRDGE